MYHRRGVDFFVLVIHTRRVHNVSAIIFISGDRLLDDACPPKRRNKHGVEIDVVRVHACSRG